MAAKHGAARVRRREQAARRRVPRRAQTRRRLALAQKRRRSAGKSGRRRLRLRHCEIICNCKTERTFEEVALIDDAAAVAFYAATGSSGFLAAPEARLLLQLSFRVNTWLRHGCGEALCSFLKYGCSYFSWL